MYKVRLKFKLSFIETNAIRTGGQKYDDICQVVQDTAHRVRHNALALKITTCLNYFCQSFVLVKAAMFHFFGWFKHIKSCCAVSCTIMHANA